MSVIKRIAMLCLVAGSLATSACSLFMTAEERELMRWVGKYEDLVVIDIHNHDAPFWRGSLERVWNKYGIDKVVLFGGHISQPKGREEDAMSWAAYQEHPDRFYPFMAALNIREEGGVAEVEKNSEKGFFGIGEVVAASSYSPVVSDAEWKGDHPLSGYFPDVYGLCAEYRKPILLHIDPPSGLPVDKLEEACDAFPDTKFIFAHANAFNSPDNLRGLLETHDNLYIDYFPGFDSFNRESRHGLEDYVDLIEAFPDRIMVSSDSGYGMEYHEAYLAMYRLFDLLSAETREKVAHLNFENLYR